MKRTFFICLSLAAGMAVVACNGSQKNEPEPKASEIEVILPDDLEEIELDWGSKDRTLDFEWESEDAEAVYSVSFSLSEDLSDAYSVEVGKIFELSMTHEELDGMMEELGVGEYRNADIYWAVESRNGNLAATSEVRSMNVFRFYKPFMDVVNNDEYKVCRVMDELTGDYYVWMAENLRAAKYSDGTAISPEVRFIGDNDGEDATMKTVYGGYYTWTGAVRGTTGAESTPKVQGACPEGWHVASKPEWDFLINCTDGENPGGALKNADYWVAEATNGGKPVSNMIGFSLPAAGYIWQSEAEGQAPLSNSVIESGKFACFWTANAPVEGDEYPWNPPVSDYPYQGVTYAFNSNDFGAALYPYVRGRGFSVRCVLD